MSDPFEESKNPLHSFPPTQLREQSIQQAVDFLNDPRVRTAHPGKALQFLLQKGITDGELREAYRRCNLPFPNPVDAQFVPQNPVSQQYPPYQQPARTSWVSVFLGLTAAAGIYTAVREVLRRYVVPLYFPDAARVADERRRREEHTFQEQERQIAELRECIQDLVASSDRTTDRMERLSKSLSSSIALRERELSETSQLRTAIQHLSHTVSMSTGTSPLQGVKSFASHPKDRSQLRGQDATKKESDRRYSGVVETSDYRKSVNLQADESQGQEAGPVHDESDTNGEQASLINGYLSSGISKQAKDKENEDDDFMSIRPAEIEESWKKGIGTGCDSSTSARSTSKVEEGEGTSGKPLEKAEDGNFNMSVGVSEMAEDGVITSAAPEVGAEVSEIGPDIVDPSRGAAASAVARQLFRFEMMREANSVLSKDEDMSSGRLRPNSMPQLDTPLSDMDP